MIIGAGMTGLAAAWASGLPVMEASDVPGGLCATCERDGYHFEPGGGHWIFGADPLVIRFLSRFCELKRYQRKAAVLIGDDLIPYPLQNNLWALDEDIACRALLEIDPNGSGTTMFEWLLNRFGPTLCKLFFYPFNRLYTSGWEKFMKPPEGYKTPLDWKAIVHGAFGLTESGGYNAMFLYPDCGLGELAKRISHKCDMRYGRRAIELETGDLSTVPLNIAAKMMGIKHDLPGTDVTVLNIGAAKGSNCPEEHWIYVPNSESGFHRVGFYSNVDPWFAPDDKVSLYVEFSSDWDQMDTSTILELQSWGWIESVDVIEESHIDPAYTWEWAEGQQSSEILNALEETGIHQVGRFARWKFQGIAESVRDGLAAGAAMRP